MSGGGAPCGACKFLRRKCVSGCVFAPYFDQDQGAAHFAAVHKIFGASNVSKLLLHIPVPKRCDAVVTICYEAEARLKDPVYGCVGHIFALQQQVVNLQAELASVQARLADVTSMGPPPASYANSYAYDQRPDQLGAPAAPLSISVSCHPASSSIAPYNNDRQAAKEESAFPWHCNPAVISPPFELLTATQQQQMDVLQRSYKNPVETEANPDDSELQALAHELLRRQYTVQLGSAGAKALSS